MFFEHFGEIFLLNYLFWGDLGGLVAVICPDFVCVQENGRSRLVFADSGDWLSLLQVVFSAMKIMIKPSTSDKRGRSRGGNFGYFMNFASLVAWVLV